MKRLLGWLFLACLVVACGDPDSGPPLGDFPAISKTTVDAPFTLTAPSSRSPAAFTFTSSNLSVATIEGATVTIKGPGTSTITASQKRTGSFGPTSTSALLTVSVADCPSGQTLINGTCQASRNCIEPATLVNDRCTLPNAATVTSGGMIWVVITRADTWTDARDYCTNTLINSVGDWHLPSADQLAAFQASGAVPASGWTVGDTWSLTAASASQDADHVVVNLRTGARANRANTQTANVSCVR